MITIKTNQTQTTNADADAIREIITNMMPALFPGPPALLQLLTMGLLFNLVQVDNNSVSQQDS